MHTFCTYWISKGGNHRVWEKFSFWGSTRRQIRCAHAEQGGHDPQGSFWCIVRTWKIVNLIRIGYGEFSHLMYLYRGVHKVTISIMIYWRGHVNWWDITEEAYKTGTQKIDLTKLKQMWWLLSIVSNNQLVHISFSKNILYTILYIGICL